MNKAVTDKAAINFAVAFYDALGAGETYDFAFELGRFQLIGLKEKETPVLLRKFSHSIKGFSGESNSNYTFVEQVVLEEPEGQVGLDSPFYVERPPIEADCYETIVKPGRLIRIKAPRQMGKSSLMSRILRYGINQGHQAITLYFQEANQEIFRDLDKFLQWFCTSITSELDFEDKLEAYWKGGTTGKNKCTKYFERYLLHQLSQSLILGLDDVDLIFQYPEVAHDFFGMLRAWQSRRITRKY